MTTLQGKSCEAILFVDDMPSLCCAIREILPGNVQDEFDIYITQTKRGAMKLLTQASVALVITDWWLGSNATAEAIIRESIHSSRSAAREIPYFIIYSALASEGEIRSIAEEFNDYVQVVEKELDPSPLINSIMEKLAKRRPFT